MNTLYNVNTLWWKMTYTVTHTKISGNQIKDTIITNFTYNIYQLWWHTTITNFTYIQLPVQMTYIYHKHCIQHLPTLMTHKSLILTQRIMLFCEYLH